jgi:hypothetical protein
MRTIDVSRAAHDLHHRAGRVVRFADLRFDGIPLPDDEVILRDGQRSTSGRVYAVHYGDETVTVLPD